MGLFSENTQNKLYSLLEKSYDTEKGFKNACNNVEPIALKRFFNAKEEEHNTFRAELIRELKANGFEVNEQSGSITGSIHRTWINTKVLFSSCNAESMLNEVRNVEKAALNDYNDVLEDNLLPSSITSILTKQRNAIESSYYRANYLISI